MCNCATYFALDNTKLKTNSMYTVFELTGKFYIKNHIESKKQLRSIPQTGYMVRRLKSSFQTAFIVYLLKSTVKLGNHRRMVAGAFLGAGF